MSDDRMSESLLRIWHGRMHVRAVGDRWVCVAEEDVTIMVKSAGFSMVDLCDCIDECYRRVSARRKAKAS